MSDEMPSQVKILEECKPEYVELPGWDEDIRSARRYSDLPPKAKKYIETIEEMVGVPVSIISVGPGREETIVLRKVFDNQ
jgi:adenylosuccinate synthase